MSNYPWTDAEILDWAGKEVREPWQKICKVAHSIYNGEEISLAEARVNIPLTPFTADYRALYPLLRDMAGLLTWSPGNLFTIILDRSEKKILRAYLERTRDNNYVELIPVDPQAPWLIEAMEMIATGREEELRRYLDEHAREKLGTWVNWVKIANIHFFGVFRKLQGQWQESDRTLPGYLDAATHAVKIIYEKNWVRFAPEPPAFAMLRELFTKILEFEPGSIDWELLLGTGGKKKRKKKKKPYILAIQGSDYLSVLQYDPAEPFHITANPAVAREALGLSMRKTPKTLAKLSRAQLALVLRAEPLANLLYEITYRRYPTDREDTKTLLNRALEIVRRYPEHWSMHPRPFYLKRRWRTLLKFLGMPYDIQALAVRDIAHVGVEGPMIFYGIHSCRAFGILKGDRLALLTSLVTTDAGLRRVKIWNPEEFQDLVEGKTKTTEELKEKAINIKHRIWDRDQWVDMIALAQADFLSRMGKLASPKAWASPWKLLITPLKMRGLKRHARKGGVAMYPDKLIQEFSFWMEKRGKRSVVSTAGKALFHTGLRTRGLLFWKGTLTIGLFLAVALAAILTFVL